MDVEDRSAPIVLPSPSEKTTPCVCPVADPRRPSVWCPRHRCEKTPRLVELCRTRPDYFAQFESGKTPQQRAQRWRGLGDLVTWLLRRTGIAWLFYRAREMLGLVTPCGCAARQDTLNRWWPFQKLR